MNFLALLPIFSTFVACETTGNVASLDESNFSSVISGNKAVLVKFFAPWCGHCVSMKRDYEQLAQYYENSVSTLITEVNCDKNGKLCRDQGIRGYPTVQLFKNGSRKACPSRKFDGMKAFIDQEVGISNKAVDDGFSQEHQEF